MRAGHVLCCAVSIYEFVKFEPRTTKPALLMVQRMEG